jgi:hypothetical protein
VDGDRLSGLAFPGGLVGARHRAAQPACGAPRGQAEANGAAGSRTPARRRWIASRRLFTSATPPARRRLARLKLLQLALETLDLNLAADRDP